MDTCEKCGNPADVTVHVTIGRPMDGTFDQCTLIGTARYFCSDHEPDGEAWLVRVLEGRKHMEFRIPCFEERLDLATLNEVRDRIGSPPLTPSKHRAVIRYDVECARSAIAFALGQDIWDDVPPKQRERVLTSSTYTGSGGVFEWPTL